MSETAADSTEWHLKPSQQIERKALHSRYGGRTQGGIGPSAKTPNVFIFTDPVAGEKHGYYDDWMPDGRFHYSGEGQYGDQRMISGNASILNHQAEGRALRVFQGARGTVTYRGEFTVDQENPWYSVDAPETNDGPLRKVIVFRLNPVDTTPQEPATKLGRLLVSHPNQVDDLPLERNENETTFVNPNQEPYEADRKEARLVKAFADYLTSNGHQSGRQRILPPGESRPLFTDIHAKELGLLIEAKGSVTRENIRMAIGQLADYSRFVDHTIRAILLPSQPREDLLALAKTQDCAVIWPEGKKFVSTNPKALP
ncbi:restriction endonuclease [Streptomyces sp. ME02-6978.2a]|uniref:restriction endonuclease n=1 Tax=Streptomyces sp. ME02-6978.2a TaxID=462922 RepID=UPI0029BDEE9B|nr:restriction endonuclease [Streptomyces sp. ME02-6978.2a]MDX3364064.1 restriction endonuclease [Streptomyces sp. ME02-6978.2a]